MFIMSYRFQLKPNSEEVYERIQQMVTPLYRSAGCIKADYLRSYNNPCEWTELHYYKDKAAYEKASTILDNDSTILELWDQFQSILDPTNPITEQQYLTVDLISPRKEV